MTIDSELLSRWMREVVEHGWQGIEQGQKPFAAAIYTLEGHRLALETNTAARTSEPSRHGEVNAIDAACRSGAKDELPNTWLVASGEPCPMCAALAAMAGIKRIAFGASEKAIAEAGYGSLGLSTKRFIEATNVQIEIVGGIEKDACNRFLLQNPA